MGGFFGAISKRDVVLDVFFGTDYHSHLGTRRGGMAVYDGSPFSVSEYSTRGGISLNCTRDTSPSRSSSRREVVSIVLDSERTITV